jgi:DNA-binding LytR/AlgR family response regulator
MALIAENEKDRLELKPEDLLYIESADNYSNIVFLKEGTISRQLIRASLKRLETQIAVPYIIRCHRSYIVNIRQAKDVSGNAQGYRIGFKPAGVDPVPVSRNYGKEVLAHLEAMR